MPMRMTWKPGTHGRTLYSYPETAAAPRTSGRAVVAEEGAGEDHRECKDGEDPVAQQRAALASQDTVDRIKAA